MYVNAPVLYPGDSINECYPFNSTIFDVSDSKAILLHVARYLGVNTSAHVAVKSVVSDISTLGTVDRRSGHDMYVMWVRPFKNQKEQTAVNDLASDLITRPNLNGRLSVSWASTVEKCLGGVNYNDLAVFGPAIVFARPEKGGAYVTCKPEWFAIKKKRSQVETVRQLLQAYPPQLQQLPRLPPMLRYTVDNTSTNNNKPSCTFSSSSSTTTTTTRTLSSLFVQSNMGNILSWQNPSPLEGEVVAVPLVTATAAAENAEALCHSSSSNVVCCTSGEKQDFNDAISSAIEEKEKGKEEEEEPPSAVALEEEEEVPPLVLIYDESDPTAVTVLPDEKNAEDKVVVAAPLSPLPPLKKKGKKRAPVIGEERTTRSKTGSLKKTKRYEDF